MSLLDFFRPDPSKRLLSQIRLKQRRAMELQRSGKIPELAKLSAEIAALEEQLTKLKATP